MIRLLHVTTVPMSLTFLKAHVPYMRDRGFELQALSSPGPELDAFGARYDVPTHSVPMPRRITPLADLTAVRRMAAVMRGIQPHIVHAHTPKGGLLGMIAARMAGVPVRIYHMRGLPLTAAEGPRRVLLRTTERTACALAHRVFCVSPSLRVDALAERLAPPDKLRVLAGGSGQGVDAAGRFDPSRLDPAARPQTRARLGIPRDARVLGFVGRLVRDKGILELERAWRALRDGDEDLHLLLVGPWEAQDPVPDTVRKRLEDDPRVHLTGLEWDTPPLYAAMDLVALPTYREGFPNVPLEAGAMELPVVATRVTGCVDAVKDGVTGTLVPVGDYRALAGVIGRYLRDPDLRRSHGRAGRARALREFRPKAILDALYEEYCMLLKEHAGMEPSIPASEVAPHA